MPSLSQIAKSKTLMFGLLLTLASVAQMLVAQAIADVLQEVA